MADYFTKFSLVLTLKNETEQSYALNLAQQARDVNQGDELPADFPADLVPEIEGWDFETDASSDEISCELWLHSEYGGIDSACAFIQHLLKKFDPDGCVTFEWSHDCTKPRVDAYGGGAAVITADKISTVNTAEWLRANAV